MTYQMLLCRCLSPKLEQLQTGKISGLSYEGVISIALRLSPPSLIALNFIK